MGDELLFLGFIYKGLIDACMGICDDELLYLGVIYKGVLEASTNKRQMRGGIYTKGASRGALTYNFLAMGKGIVQLGGSDE